MNDSIVRPKLIFSNHTKVDDTEIKLKIAGYMHIVKKIVKRGRKNDARTWLVKISSTIFDDRGVSEQCGNIIKGSYSEGHRFQTMPSSGLTALQILQGGGSPNPRLQRWAEVPGIVMKVSSYQ